MNVDTQSIFSTFSKFWIAGTSIIGSLLVFLILAIVLLVAKAEDTQQSNLSSKTLYEGDSDQIAVVDISGIIIDQVESSDPFAFESGRASVRDLVVIFDELKETESVKAVVLRINSPGGAVVASDELYLAIKELSEEKVVIAQLNDLAASGGYYAALGADKIIANRATITGSIGVIAQFPEFTELFEKVGVELTTIKSGDLKDIGAIDREMTAEEQAILQAIIDDAYQQFVDAVESGRNLPREEVLQLADGRIYSGSQAKEAGLVDEIGTYDDALDLAKSDANLEDPSIVEYNQESFFSLLFSSINRVSPTAQLAKVIPTTSFGVYYLLSL